MTLTSKLTPGHKGVRLAIEEELTALFDTRTTAAGVYGDAFVRLWALAGSSMLGGKLVRPLLVVETYDALTHPDSIGTPSAHTNIGEHGTARSDRQTVVSIAAAIELLHFSFLLHDDVIDGDLIRRGRPNLIGALLNEASATPIGTAAIGQTIDQSTESRLHWARAGGILMGDLLLASTHQTFARAQLPTSTRHSLLDLLDETITESVAGELLDVGLGDGIITPDLGTILAMCAYKTATYSFEFPLRAAAVLAGASPEVERTLLEAGRHLGLAFQLQDDLLSTFGDPADHGKDPFSDLREGKQTTLIAYARNTTAWPSIEATFGLASLSLEDGLQLRSALTGCGAEEFVRNLVDDQMNAFSSLVNSSNSMIPPRVRSVLEVLAQQLDGRRS